MTSHWGELQEVPTSYIDGDAANGSAGVEDEAPGEAGTGEEAKLAVLAGDLATNDADLLAWFGVDEATSD